MLEAEAGVWRARGVSTISDWADWGGIGDDIKPHIDREGRIRLGRRTELQGCAAAAVVVG